MDKVVSYSNTKLSLDNRFALSADLMDDLREIVSENGGDIIDGLDVLMRCFCMLSVVADQEAKTDDAEAVTNAVSTLVEFYKAYQIRHRVLHKEREMLKAQKDSKAATKH